MRKVDITKFGYDKSKLKIPSGATSKISEKTGELIKLRDYKKPKNFDIGEYSPSLENYGVEQYNSSRKRKRKKAKAKRCKCKK
jgi:hypothetical protein